MSAKSTYLRELHDALGMIPVWPPHQKYELGDIVEVESDSEASLRFVGSLSSIGLGTSNTRLSRSIGQLRHRSSTGVTVRFKGVGDVLPNSHIAVAKAGVCVEFSAQHALVFDAQDCTTHLLDDLPTLSNEIAQAEQQKRWRTSWCLVTELVLAQRTTLYISASQGGRAEIEASGPAISSLADASAELRLVAEKDLATHYTAAGNLSPLVRLWRLQRRWWPLGPKELGPYASGDKTSDAHALGPGVSITEFLP